MSEQECMSEAVTIDRFEAGIESKVISALNKVFTETNNCSEDQAVKLDNCSVTDPAHVCMISGKTERAKRVLSRFVDSANIPNIPTLDYKITGVASSLYPMDYTIMIFNVLKHTSDHYKFTTAIDYPCKIESSDFEFLLAPRIEEC